MPLSLEEQHELVLMNQKLVHYFVNKLKVAPSDYDDVVSIGTIGLIKAAATYDEAQGKFSTYASQCINNEIFMHYRKANKYANDISLSQPFTANKDGEELTLEATLEHPGSNFTEKILDKETFIKLFSIILNYLNGAEQYTILYHLADINQRDIAKYVNISQSYVSRLERKVIRKIKECIENAVKYQEVFFVTAIGNSYKISFSSKDIHSFNKIFASLLQNITSIKTLPDFKVDCNKERIVILLPASDESFSFLAKIMQEIDDFTMTFVSNKAEPSTTNTQSADVSIKTEANVSGKLEETTQEILSIQGSESIARIASSTSAIPEEATLEVYSKSKQIRDYILSKDSFTFAELKENFPNIKEGTIAQFLLRLKKENIIISISRGHYKVNKS